MIEIANAVKRFGKKTAVDNISMSVADGTICGIIGENGAGKTTLIHLVTGIYKPDSGSIKVMGEEVYDNLKVKASIGYVADQNQFFPGYKVREMTDFFAGVYPAFSREKFNRLNELYKLDVNKKISRLSKGMQMRLAIMLNIAACPKLLVLDEPTSGLDAVSKNQFIDFVIEEAYENNMTVFISSHHLSEMERLCENIFIMSNGKVSFSGSVDGLKNKVKKIQVVFDGNAPDFSKFDNLLDVSNIGSVYYLVTKDYTEELDYILRHHGAKIIEEIGMSLEEIFIHSSKEA